MCLFVISCKKDSEDIIQGLKFGGDDYITKPFDPQCPDGPGRGQASPGSYFPARLNFTGGARERYFNLWQP